MINFCYISIDIFHLVPEMPHWRDVQERKKNMITNEDFISNNII